MFTCADLLEARQHIAFEPPVGGGDEGDTGIVVGEWIARAVCVRSHHRTGAGIYAPRPHSRA